MSNIGGGLAGTASALARSRRQSMRPSFAMSPQTSLADLQSAQSAWDSGNPFAFEGLDGGRGYTDARTQFLGMGQNAGLFDWSSAGGRGPEGQPMAGTPRAVAGGSGSGAPAGLAGARGAAFGGAANGSAITGLPKVGGGFGSSSGGGSPTFGGTSGFSVSGGRVGGGLDASLDSAYKGLIDSKGKILSDPAKAGAINRATGTIGRGANDALQAAREDAVRRGDTTGSTLGTTEAQIRGQSAADQAKTAANMDLAFSQADMNNLQQSLQGGTGLMQARGNLALGQGQLGLAGSQLNLQQIQALAALMKDGGLSPEVLASMGG